MEKQSSQQVAREYQESVFASNLDGVTLVYKLEVAFVCNLFLLWCHLLFLQEAYSFQNKSWQSVYIDCIVNPLEQVCTAEKLLSFRVTWDLGLGFQILKNPNKLRRIKRGCYFWILVIFFSNCYSSHFTHTLKSFEFGKLACSILMQCYYRK